MITWPNLKNHEVVGQEEPLPEIVVKEATILLLEEKVKVV